MNETTDPATDEGPVDLTLMPPQVEGLAPTIDAAGAGFDPGETVAATHDAIARIATPETIDATHSGATVDPAATVAIDRAFASTVAVPHMDATHAAPGNHVVDGKGAPKPRTKLPPAIVPGYLVLEEIARGGMGVVYKAQHIRLKRLVALKRVLAGAHASPEQLERFAVESQAVAQFQHPGIVQIYEVGEYEGLPFFSLEFVSGGSLAQKIAGKPQPTREAAEMLRDLSVAMQEAHSRNIVHRDLKPANVLLTDEGRPKITDFGLAKRMDSDSDMTRSGAIMGTPSYMAPEQAWGRTHEVGPLSDIYALGAILYEMLVGRPPFQGSSALETLELARTQEPVPPTRLQPKIPVDLETICLKCLQKEPGKRYADAGALADDLQRFLDRRPIQARPVGSAERLVRWCRRNPKVAGLAATVAFLLVTVTAVSSAAAVRLDRMNTDLEGANKAEGKARMIAERNEFAAIKARNEEAAARQKESDARKRAEDVAKFALEQNKIALTAQRYISVLLDKRLRDFPGTQELRAEMIRTSREGLRANVDVMDKLALVLHDRDKEGAALADRTLAGIYQRAGGLMEDLGRYDEATGYYRQMDRLAEALSNGNPGLIEARKVLAASKFTIADFEFDRLGDTETALGHYNENLKIRRELLARAPNEDEAKRGVCNGLGRLGRAWLKLGDPGKARDYYREEATLRDTITPGLAAEVEVRRERAGLEEKLGDLSVALNDNAGARAHYDRSLELREQIAQQNADHTQAQRDLLLSYKRIGTYELIQGNDPARARITYTKALDEFLRRLRAEPDSVVAREDVAVTEYYVATACLRSGDRKGADTHYKECLKIREALANDPKAKLNTIDLMIIQARCGQHQLASKTANELITTPPLDARVYFQAACGFALCAGSLAETPNAPDARTLVRRYTDNAFKALHLALNAGWKSLVDVETDPDLDAIRKDPGYVAVVAEFKQASAK